MVGALRKFAAANQKLCQKIEPHLPQARADLHSLYVKLVARYMNSKAGQTVVDVGGGRSCPFAKYKTPTQEAKIIAVDVSEEELKYNTDVDEKKVADIVQGLPFNREEIDLIVSSWVLEHLENLDEFVVISQQILREGGYFIHLFSSKFAPFALINQAMSHALAKKILYFFLPEHKGISGFPAFYNNCFYSGINKVLLQHDLEIIEVHISYYQSRYFGFCAPLFLLSALYEILIRAIGAKNLCAYLLVVARKRSMP